MLKSKKKQLEKVSTEVALKQAEELFASKSESDATSPAICNGCEVLQVENNHLKKCIRKLQEQVQNLSKG